MKHPCGDMFEFRQIEMRLQEGFLCFTAVSEYRNSQIAANKSKTHADA